FNENSFTIASITLISVVSIIIVPVLQIINSAEASFILIALGTVLAAVLSSLVFAVPKILIAMGHMAGEDINSALQQRVKASGGAVSSVPNKGSITAKQTGAAKSVVSNVSETTGRSSGSQAQSRI
ncbi:hypothetical protein HDV00_007703, partial [Rhizophlyctis rosea]